MKASLPTLAVAGLAIVAAAVFAALYFTKEPRTTGAATAKPTSGRPCAEQRLFGHVRSLVRKGAGFELRFDPAWFTTGLTANTAAAEDGAVPPGQPVPNDNYVVDEGHRMLLFRVPGNAHVTVLTNTKKAGPLYATRVTVSQLAQLVRGKRPVKLFESLGSGFWIRTRADSACAIDQQYRP